LPTLHADPFDRGIIATGLHRDLAVATVDPVFAAYVIPSGVRLVG
jgi:PIN domain nuclease of toxin-antitoxin system